MEDNTKGTIADDFTLSVLHLSCLASKAILNLFANDLCVETCKPRLNHKNTLQIIPPILRFVNAEDLCCCDISRVLHKEAEQEMLSRKVKVVEGHRRGEIEEVRNGQLPVELSAEKCLTNSRKGQCVMESEYGHGVRSNMALKLAL